MESQKMHLRHVMLHCFKKGNSAKDTADEIFTVYKSGTTTIRTVHNWFKKFRADNFELKDEDRSGRSDTINADKYCNQLDRLKAASSRKTARIESKLKQFWKEGIMRLPERWKKVIDI
ncbi:Histone-lysine N-methyltransferase SETMAR [Melipona quadrifasciata]|uniref:Histone-lysine N-methyltransferase SETMAR n=1 Tax=Melipona quadrifasciata TaxID=166423 RepID=A0A0N0BG74_9HYME|nr:Histone-lysine N-methyltransferase SETMAR [Melipona quadrifasciata]